jgi:hypothetical protein
MFPYKILNEFENGSSWIKNMAAIGRGSFFRLVFRKISFFYHLTLICYVFAINY